MAEKTPFSYRCLMNHTQDLQGVSEILRGSIREYGSFLNVFRATVHRNLAIAFRQS